MGKVLQGTRLLLQAFLNFGQCPAGQRGGLENHQLVGSFSQNMRGGKSVNLPILNPLHKLAARSSESRVRAKMIDERVRIQKNGVPGRKVGEDHGPPSGRNSGSRATRSMVSASPVQPMIP